MLATVGVAAAAPGCIALFGEVELLNGVLGNVLSGEGPAGAQAAPVGSGMDCGNSAFGSPAPHFVSETDPNVPDMGRTPEPVSPTVPGPGAAGSRRTTPGRLSHKGKASHVQ
jgi:hypothetical protein